MRRQGARESQAQHPVKQVVEAVQKVPDARQAKLVPAGIQFNSEALIRRND
jgi:hypothetical protein